MTGASSGIGLHLANRLTDFGAHVFGVARRKRPTDLKVEVKYLQGDITLPTDIDRIGVWVGQHLEKLDGILNVAGTSLSGIEDHSVSIFNQTLLANLTSPFMLISKLTPMLQGSRKASIINFTSINSSLGFPNNPGYVASKAGLAGLTRALAIDLAQFGVRVNSIAPGYFHTPMTTRSFNDVLKNKNRSDRTVLKRWGDLEDLVGGTVWLLSDSSSFVTGQEICIDGGWTILGLSAE